MMLWRKSANKKYTYKTFCGQLQGHGWVWLMMGANRGRRQATLPTHFVSSTNYCRRLGWVLSKHAIVLAMADTIIPPVHPSTQRLSSDCLSACSVSKLPHRSYESTGRKRKWITLGVWGPSHFNIWAPSQIILHKILALKLMMIPSIDLTINRECKKAKELLLSQHEVN